MMKRQTDVNACLIHYVGLYSLFRKQLSSHGCLNVYRNLVATDAPGFGLSRSVLNKKTPGPTPCLGKQTAWMRDPTVFTPARKSR
jgi:hypothetical protein